MIAVIPARGGSKGLHRKNLRHVGGVPLVSRSINAALGAKSIDRVIVSTDDDEIAEVSMKSGAEVVMRPDHLADDIIMPDMAAVHVLSQLRADGIKLPEVACFLQPTSPFIFSSDLDNALEKFHHLECDSLFSAMSTHSFFWGDSKDSNYVESLNHDSSFRLGRQQLSPQYTETGAFYLFKTIKFLEMEHRFFGNIGSFEMPSIRSIDIDGIHDLEMAEILVSNIEKDIS